MLESDAYQSGYDDGVEDAKNGKSRNFARVCRYSRRSAINSYCEGYKKGYEAGCFLRAMGR
ncbi:MAG: hypothetical protein IKS22_13580 [Bacteroidales bacterium]|nr:hypothetical protein [Bacteroidales bacterium]